MIEPTGELFHKEADRNLKLRDTIPLPLAPGEFIHVETSKRQLTDAFAEFAEMLGYDREQARVFFTNNVDPTFGTSKSEPMQMRGMTKFDIAFADALGTVYKFYEDKPLGRVMPTVGGRYELIINTPEIARQIPQIRKVGGVVVGDYNRQTIEQKIASVAQIINTITFHEFDHLLRLMKQGETVIQSLSKEGLRKLRIIAISSPIIMALGFASALTVPEHALLVAPAVVVMGSAAVAGGTLYLEKRGGGHRIEMDAHKTQKFASRMDLIKKPYTFIHESDSKVE